MFYHSLTTTPVEDEPWRTFKSQTIIVTQGADELLTQTILSSLFSTMVGTTARHNHTQIMSLILSPTLLLHDWQIK